MVDFTEKLLSEKKNVIIKIEHSMFINLMQLINVLNLRHFLEIDKQSIRDMRLSSCPYMMFCCFFAQTVQVIYLKSVSIEGRLTNEMLCKFSLIVSESV